MIVSTAYAATVGAEAVHAGPFYAQPEFWVAVAFITVVFLVARPVFRAVVAGLDNRADRIRARLEEARKLREDAQALLAVYQRKQRESQLEAEEIVANARTETERMRREALLRLDEEIKRREQQAMERISQAEAQALAEVRNMAVDLAMRSVAELARDSLSAEQHAALINKAIEQVSGKLN